MKATRSLYFGHRYPREIISHAVWLYYRFGLSLRDVEDLLAERGIVVTYETIRRWCRKFGLEYVRRLKQRQGRLGDTWFLDEVFVTINGDRQYLWRAVDQDGDVIDILVQSRVSIPEFTMHSFEGWINAAIWYLYVHADIKRWPDVDQEYAVTISPLEPQSS